MGRKLEEYKHQLQALLQLAFLKGEALVSEPGKLKLVIIPRSWSVWGGLSDSEE